MKVVCTTTARAHESPSSGFRIQKTTPTSTTTHAARDSSSFASSIFRLVLPMRTCFILLRAAKRVASGMTSSLCLSSLNGAAAAAARPSPCPPSPCLDRSYSRTTLDGSCNGDTRTAMCVLPRGWVEGRAARGAKVGRLAAGAEEWNVQSSRCGSCSVVESVGADQSRGSLGTR